MKRQLIFVLLIFILLVSIGSTTALEFNETFGIDYFNPGQPTGSFITSRSDTWIRNQKPIVKFDNSNWYWYGTGLGDRINLVNDLTKISTPYGILYHGYSPSGTKDGGIGYVFDQPINLTDQFMTYSCALASGADSKSYIIFQKESGQGGFCVQLQSIADCEFSFSYVGCHGDYDTYCAVQSCTATTRQDKTFDFNSIPVEHRENITSVEFITSHSGGAWGEPNIDTTYLDDLYFTYELMPTPVFCGDGDCDFPSETYLNCPVDCDSFCGDGICDNVTEIHYGNCPEDCDSYCGDGYCNPETETNITCSEDCGEPGSDEPEPEDNKIDWRWLILLAFVLLFLFRRKFEVIILSIVIVLIFLELGFVWWLWILFVLLLYLILRKKEG